MSEDLMGTEVSSEKSSHRESTSTPGAEERKSPTWLAMFRRAIAITVPVVALLIALRIPADFGLDLYPTQRLAIVLGVVLLYLYTRRPATLLQWIGSLVPLALGLLSLWNIVWNYEEIYKQAGTPTLTTVFFATCLIVVVIDAVRREYKIGVALVFGAFALYPLIAQYMPGILQARPHSWERISAAFYTQRDGIFGAPLEVGVEVVTVFIILGALFYRLGIADKISDLSLWAFGRFRGGPAKVAVISSGAMGSVSGSASGNVATTGVVTIPLMKRVGYPSAVAGGIEATASTAGLLLPPIMGAAAFIMAEFTGIAYSDIVISAAVPALLLFLGIFVFVDIEAKRRGIIGMPRLELPRFQSGAAAIYLMGLPIVTLVYMLVAVRATPVMAGTWAIVVLLVVAFLNKDSRPTVKKLIQSLEESVVTLTSIVVVVAAAGLAVGAVTITGLGASLVQAVFMLAGESMFLALVLTAVASIVLGMSMPAVGVYVILAMIVAPGLEQLGVEPLAAHLFVFYFGALSFITPPVSIAAFMAASIARARPFETAFQALKVAASAFVIPFLMVYNTNLLLIGDNWAIQFVSIALAVIGVMSFSALFASGRKFSWPRLVNGLLAVGSLAALVAIG